MSHTGSPKQFLSIGGVPVLVRSLRIFADLRNVSSLTVAVRAPEAERVREMVAEHFPATKIQVVAGGDTRQESVSNALASLREAADEDIVLVHDAVRPLIDHETITRTVEAVEKHGAAIVGTPALDTIKVVERTADGALITSTIPRERVVLAQTPQGFRVGLLRKAFAEAEADGFVGTDEASLAERSGIPVVVVSGPPRNFKITHPGDLELAEFYFSSRS
jgi:2-C-methyl-D-erythritol 4-phosphate cytidylyltransferase